MYNSDTKLSGKDGAEAPFEDNLVEHEVPSWFPEKFTFDQCSSEPEDCCIPETCKISKECVKTYKCHYKLYKISHYHLCKVCSLCGHEFDYYYYQGSCPRCY